MPRLSTPACTLKKYHDTWIIYLLTLSISLSFSLFREVKVESHVWGYSSKRLVPSTKVQS